MSSTSAPPGAPTAQAPDPRRWLVLPVILVAVFMGVFDFYVVNVAAPSLEDGLHTSEAALQLVIGGYSFTYASALITGGRLGDLFSYRRLFMIGMSLFTVASVLCGIAQNSDELVAARLLQGFGAAAMVPQVIALIQIIFPPAERPGALSWYGVSLGLGLVSGQVLGGVLLNADVFGIGWRIIFLVNLPIGIITLAFAHKLLPKDRSARRPALDLVGTIGVSVSLGLAVLPLIVGRTEGWPVWTWVMMAASVIGMTATVFWERALHRQGGEPLLDPSLFQVRSFTVGLLMNITVMMFYAGFIFGLTLFLQIGLGLSPLEAGLTFGPLGLAFAVTSLLARPLTMKYGAKVITVGSSALVVGVLALFLELQIGGVDADAPWFIPPMILAGLGTGLTVPSLVGVVVSQVPPRQAGLASGLLTTAQQFAITGGVAVLGVVFFETLGSHPTRSSFVSSLEWVSGIGMGLALVTTAMSLLLPRRRPAPPGGAPAGAPAGAAVGAPGRGNG